MKDAVLTVRLPAATRRRLAALARKEGRSLSAQAERLIEQGIGGSGKPGARRGARTLAGSLAGGSVPTLRDFRDVRALLAVSLQRRTSRNGP
jgi:hypothetical protein